MPCSKREGLKIPKDALQGAAAAAVPSADRDKSGLSRTVALKYHAGTLKT